MARSAGRPLQLFTVADMRNQCIPFTLLDIIEPNRSNRSNNQAHYLVVARTKVAAAARLDEVMRDTIRPGAIGEAVGNTVVDIRRQGLLGPDTPTGGIDVKCEGAVLVWRGVRDTAIVRFAPGSTEPAVVAHFRYLDGAVRVVPTGIDPTLLPTRQVTVAGPLVVGRYGDAPGVTRDEYPGGVQLYSDATDEVFVSGLGRIRRARAEELLRGLAGALAELDNRKSGAKA